MKKHIYRVGDKVRIVTPKFVRRVGYPLVWTEIDDALLYDDERIGKALLALGCFPALLGDLQRPADDIPRHLQVAFAQEYVLQHKFGGNERTIHYHDPVTSSYRMLLNWTCGPAGVLGKRVAKTGTRFPAWYSRDPEYDETPGGLDNCQTHVLLSLGMGYEIEACNVEPWSR